MQTSNSLISIPWFIRLALRRLASQWRSLLNIAVGVLLTAVIGASIPLYTTAITQVGMVQYITAQPSDDVHIAARLSITASEVDDLGLVWEALNTGLVAAVTETFDGGPPDWLSQIVIMGETSSLDVVKSGADLGARAQIAYYEGWQETMRLVEGEWPASSGGDILEVVIGSRAAAEMGLSVGDRITLEQRGWESSRPVQARVVAIVRPIDPGAPYWLNPSPLRMGRSRQGLPESNLLTGKAQFLDVAADHVPDTRTTFGWRILFDHSALPFDQVGEMTARLEQFKPTLNTQIIERVDVENLRVLYNTELPEVLNAFAGEVTLLGAPFGLVLLQLGALVLFFLVVTAALVRRSERREIAMLQSRGALDRQIILLRSVEALVICILMTLAAPFVAQRILLWLTPLLTGITRLPLSLGPAPFLYAGSVSVAALVLLLFTLRPILRLPLVQAGGKGARSEKQAWWQRYYIDVMLLVVGVAALWRMLSTGSALATAGGGALQADPLLLLAPALLCIALGSMLLRFFPTVMDLAARFFAARHGLIGSLATWQLSREPTHYGRITFLLTLAIAIGWFATSFQATMTLSQRDRARYAVGADIRMVSRDIAFDVERTGPLDHYVALPQVEAATHALRFFVSNISGDSRRPVSGEILAISPDTFDAVAYWRDDLGLLELPSGESYAAPGRTLPAQTARVGVWMRFDMIEETGDEGAEQAHLVDPSRGRPELWARLRDSTGTFVHLPLTEATSPDASHPLLEAEAWHYMEGDLTALASGYVPQGALALDSIYWSSRLMGWYLRDLRLSLTGLSLIDDADNLLAPDWLTEAGAAWELVTDPLVAPVNTETRFAAASGLASSDTMSRQVIWDEDNDKVSIAGLFLDYPAAGPLPAIASDTFLALNNLLPGAQYQLSALRGGMAPWFEIAGTTHYYPSLYPDERPFLVIDLDALLYTLNRRPGAAVYPAEVWLRLSADAGAQEMIAAFEETHDERFIIDETLTLTETLESLQTDLLTVGLMGLLYLAFIVALLLSMVSLLTYFALTVQARRGEFGVLRAFGLTSSRMAASIALEQILVMIAAMLMGTALGLILSYQVLPVLALGASGEAVTPPFIVQVETGALLRYGLVLLGALGTSLAASLWLVRRLSPAQTLRLGEE